MKTRKTLGLHGIVIEYEGDNHRWMTKADVDQVMKIHNPKDRYFSMNYINWKKVLKYYGDKEKEQELIDKIVEIFNQIGKDYKPNDSDIYFPEESCFLKYQNPDITYAKGMGYVFSAYGGWGERGHDEFLILGNDLDFVAYFYTYKYLSSWLKTDLGYKAEFTEKAFNELDEYLKDKNIDKEKISSIKKTLNNLATTMYYYLNIEKKEIPDWIFKYYDYELNLDFKKENGYYHTIKNDAYYLEINKNCTTNQPIIKYHPLKHKTKTK